MKNPKGVGESDRGKAGEKEKEEKLLRLDCPCNPESRTVTSARDRFTELG